MKENDKIKTVASLAMYLAENNSQFIRSTQQSLIKIVEAKIKLLKMNYYISLILTYIAMIISIIIEPIKPACLILVISIIGIAFVRSNKIDQEFNECYQQINEKNKEYEKYALKLLEKIKNE